MTVNSFNEKSWRSEKLKFVAPLRDVKRDFRPESDVYVGLENIESGTGKYLASDIAYVPDGQVNVFSKGAVLFGKLRPYLAKVLRPNWDGVSTGELLVLCPRPEIATQSFLYYRLIADDFIKSVDNSTYGAKMPRASWDFIGNVLLQWPSIAEQEKIADFLDEKTVSIDAAVQKKQKLLALLREKRAAIISQVVTKGLGPNVNFIDSGVVGLGKVPESWILTKLKFLARRPLQYGLNEPGSESIQSNTRYVRITDLDNSGGLWEDTFASVSDELAAGYLLEDGDILFARSGATAGKSFQYKVKFGRCSFAGYLIRFSPDQTALNSDFLWFITQSSFYTQWKDAVFVQATIQNISAEKYKEFVIPLPSLAEQGKMVQVLANKVEAIDKVLSKIEKSIALLAEYKATLITSAVTGKIAVN